jgi:hypothetical protein
MDMSGLLVTEDRSQSHAGAGNQRGLGGNASGAGNPTGATGVDDGEAGGNAGIAGVVDGVGAGGTATGACAFDPRATRTPRDFIQALNSSAVMFLPFWLMLKRQGVLSNWVRGL